MRLLRHHGTPRLSARLAVALLTAALLAQPSLSLAASGAATAAGTHAAAPAADDALIVHMLGRLGFGPRPGQVEEVQRMGLDAWIERQLSPGRLDDRALAGRLDGLTTLELSTEDLVNRYYRPAFELRRKVQMAQRDTPAADDATAPAPEDMQAMAMSDDADALASARSAMQARRAAAREVLSEEEIRQLEEATRGVRQVQMDLAAQKILRATYSERQLEEVLVDFWFNHFNVYAGKPIVQPYVPAFERDVIRPHVFGSFRDLLGAVAQSPAMLTYLDNWQSAAPPGAQTLGATPGRGGAGIGQRGGRMGGAGRGGGIGGRRPGMGGLGPNTGRGGQTPARPAGAQRPARGLNENYARELLELHTIGVDGGYTQDDIVNVARAFTGWTIQQPRQGGGFVFNPRMHDAGSKQVLGTTLPAGGGQEDGERVLDLLARHPSTATFIATKLARRFVADDPPQSLVARAAETFRRTDGNLRDVVRTIVTSPELRAEAARGAKVKSPFEFVVSALRATGADVRDARAVTLQLRTLGQPLYHAQPPTGYTDESQTWVSTGTLLARMNSAVALAGGRVPGVEVPPAGGDADAARDHALTTLLHGQASATTEATLARATTPHDVLALALGSPEFQRR